MYPMFINRVYSYVIKLAYVFTQDCRVARPARRSSAATCIRLGTRRRVVQWRRRAHAAQPQTAPTAANGNESRERDEEKKWRVFIMQSTRANLATADSTQRHGVRRNRVVREHGTERIDRAQLHMRQQILDSGLALVVRAATVTSAASDSGASAVHFTGACVQRLAKQLENRAACRLAAQNNCRRRRQ